MAIELAHPVSSARSRKTHTRILHTADWHLGHRLVEQDRHEEHQLFLNWLAATIREREIDLLIVAGDIFDSANPSKEAETLYFNFLVEVSQTTKCEIVIVAGNHDSPMHLNAPAKVLKLLRIHVVGSMPEEAQESTCFIPLQHAVLCAVPFLRERDLRRSRAGETFSEVLAEFREGIARRYGQLLASHRENGKALPLIVTGHLTTVGGNSSESEREIHIGSLGAVEAKSFEGFDYVALGHLHRPQTVGGQAQVRYAGSPIPLSFSEAEDGKAIVIFEADGRSVTNITSLAIPCQRRLLRWKGASEDLLQRLQSFRTEETFPAWFELTVDELSGDLDKALREAVHPDHGRVLKVLAELKGSDAAFRETGVALEDLNPRDVFLAKLSASKIAPDSNEWQDYTETFAQLMAIREEK
jgi:exonuclease SbcD